MRKSRHVSNITKWINIAILMMRKYKQANQILFSTQSTIIILVSFDLHKNEVWSVKWYLTKLQNLLIITHKINKLQGQRNILSMLRQ